MTGTNGSLRAQHAGFGVLLGCVDLGLRRFVHDLVLPVLGVLLVALVVSAGLVV